jgi:flagella basal body P-ring formation protein FlgA
MTIDKQNSSSRGVPTRKRSGRRGDLFITFCLICLIIIPAVSYSSNLDNIIKEKIISLYNIDTSRCDVEVQRNHIGINPDEFDSLTVSRMAGSITDAKLIPRGSVSLQINFFKNNNEIKSGQIRVRIRHYENVLVSVDRFKRHDLPIPDKYMIKRMEITSLTENPVTSEDELSGKWARRNVGIGQILTSRMFETIPAITVGQQVSILYKSSCLELTARGTALQPGDIGDMIKIKNNQSKKIIACTVMDDETVQVNSH